MVLKLWPILRLFLASSLLVNAIRRGELEIDEGSEADDALDSASNEVQDETTISEGLCKFLKEDPEVVEHPEKLPLCIAMLVENSPRPRDKLPPWKWLNAFLIQQNEKMKAAPALHQVEVNESDDELVFVIGDLHGELHQLLFMMQSIKEKVEAIRLAAEKEGAITNVEKGPLLLQCGAGVKYVFLGDYVDRSHLDIHVAALVLAYRMICRDHVVLLRGNHEIASINERNGFEENVQAWFRPHGWFQILASFHQAWTTLSLAATINKKVFLVHGGISENMLPQSLEENNFEGFASHFESEASKPGHRNADPEDPSSMVNLILWADPQKDLVTEFGPSKRGSDLINYGKKAVERLKRTTGLELVIRGHEAKDLGYDDMRRYEKDFNVLTVFSAANYCGAYGNNGAFALLKSSSLLKPMIFSYQSGNGEGVGYARRLRQSVTRWRRSSGYGHEVQFEELKQDSKSALLQSGVSAKELLANVEGIVANTSQPTDYCNDVGEMLAKVQEFAGNLSSSGDEEQSTWTELLLFVEQFGEAGPVSPSLGDRERVACDAMRLAIAVKQLVKEQSGDDEVVSVLEKVIAMRRAQFDAAKAALQEVFSVESLSMHEETSQGVGA